MGVESFFRVPNLLILSYRVFLFVSALGVILGSFNFGYGPVAQPPEATVDLSSIEWSPDIFYTDIYKNHTRYLEDAENYGNYNLVPGFYVVLPCGVGAIFAGTFVVLDFLLKDLAGSTVGLYSSLGLLSMMVGFTLTYQIKRYLPRGYESFLHSYFWVTAFHSLMLTLLLLQIILSIWELCRRKLPWPTIHFSHFVTIGMVARAVLVILSTNMLIAFFLSTIHGSRDSYDEPVLRYPEYLFMPCAIAGLYGLLVSFEAFTSQIFGHVHNKMMGISGIIMTLSFLLVMIISSPSVSGQLVVHYDNLHISMIFSGVCFGISVIYAPLCLLYPGLLNTPPAIIRYLAYGMAHMKCTEDPNKAQQTEACSCRCSNICRGIVALSRSLRTSDTLRTNMILAIMSFVCVVILSVSWAYNDSCVVMLCTDIAILYRTLPAMITELSTGIPPDTQPFQAVFQYFLEATPLFIGLILTYFTTGDVAHFTANALNIIIVIFQFYKVQTNPAVKAKINAALKAKANPISEERLADEEQPMAEGVNGDAPDKEQ